MIDFMIEVILKEARARGGNDRIQAIYDVMKELEEAVQALIKNVKLIEGEN